MHSRKEHLTARILPLQGLRNHTDQRGVFQLVCGQIDRHRDVLHTRVTPHAQLTASLIQYPLAQGQDQLRVLSTSLLALIHGIIARSFSPGRSISILATAACINSRLRKARTRC